MVGPGQHVLLAAQVLGAEVLLQRHHVGQFLARVGDGFHVDHRHRRVLGEALEHDVFAVLGPVDELGEGAHGDQVTVAAQHLGHFGDVFLGVPVHHRAQVELDRPGILARLQHDRVPAQLEGTQLEAGAGAHGRVEEHQGNRFALELVAQFVALEQRGLGQQGIQVGAAPVLGVQEVLQGHRSILCGWFSTVAGGGWGRRGAFRAQQNVYR
ncbi:hypothetical protein D3C71_1426040 [compost metagenome]